jgi:dihydrofolate reductase
MAKVVAFESVTLDGVMQSPGHPDEDRRGGFEHGGWAAPYADDVIQGLAAEGSETNGSLLFGRRTYEDLYRAWAHATDNPFTEILNNTTKYLASRTLAEPLAWQSSILLGDDVPGAVAELRQRNEKDLLILGSGELVRSLLPHGLVDRFILLIHPIVLGSGIRLFEPGAAYANLRLVGAPRQSTTGVIIATYEVSSAKPA